MSSKASTAPGPIPTNPSSHRPSVRELLGYGPIDIDALARRLEALDEAGRVAFVRGLKKADMLRLWDACEGREVTADDFVPRGTRIGTEVIHKGKNSLPAFSDFEKRFTPADGRPGQVYGYNHNWFNFTTAGPGYFVGHFRPDETAFGLDYYEVPPVSAPLPATWPKVRKNEIGLQVLIYAKMVDYMRKVCDGVTIGRAWMRGKRTSNFFLLARTGV